MARVQFPAREPPYPPKNWPLLWDTFFYFCTGFHSLHKAHCLEDILWLIHIGGLYWWLNRVSGLWGKWVSSQIPLFLEFLHITNHRWCYSFCWNIEGVRLIIFLQFISSSLSHLLFPNSGPCHLLLGLLPQPGHGPSCGLTSALLIAVKVTSLSCKPDRPTHVLILLPQLPVNQIIQYLINMVHVDLCCLPWNPCFKHCDLLVGLPPMLPKLISESFFFSCWLLCANSNPRPGWGLLYSPPLPWV